MLTPEPIKLSICIATFNRVRFIGETLDGLISQLTGEVEIVVLDGGSTDGTEEILRQYEKACPRLRYVRQTTNNGVDRDFDRAVEVAAGEYCWLMSDDDLVKEGAIANVLARLEKGYSLLIINSEVKSHDFSKLLEQRRLPFESDRIYRSDELDRLFIETGLYLTFIGCVVIKRDIWIERQREPYFGSQFIHMGVIFQRRLPQPVEVIAATLITIRYGNASWKSKEFEIWMYRWPTLVRSLVGLSEHAMNVVSPRESWARPKTLLLYRAKGAYTLRDFRLWIKPRTSFLKAIVPRLIAVVPGPMINAVALAYYSRSPVESAMTLSDLKSSRFYYRNWPRASR
jgi:glycosyltransferase involved in cell wall biosynthesis